MAHFLSKPYASNSVSPVRTNIYVDGFNLYYGAAKHTAYKWLNIQSLCLAVMPSLQIHRIRYFTALVNATSSDPTLRQRQETYIRALKTIPNLSVHLGHYLDSVVMAPLASPPAYGSRYVEVLKREEKGSDVNIATYMLVDAFRQDCEQLVVITNDSDLTETVRIINQELDMPVGVFNPHSKDTATRKAKRLGKPCKATPSFALRQAARFIAIFVHRDPIATWLSPSFLTTFSIM